MCGTHLAGKQLFNRFSEEHANRKLSCPRRSQIPSNDYQRPLEGKCFPLMHFPNVLVQVLIVFDF